MQQTPFQADRLHLLLSFPAGPEANYQDGQNLVGKLEETFQNEAACQRLAGFANKTLSHPALRLFLEQTLRARGPLFSLRTERIEQQNILVRVDMLKSDLLKSVLAQEADQHVKEIEQSWIVRTINWVCKKLMDAKELEKMDRDGNAKFREQFLHEVSTRLYILMLDAAALELIDAAGDMGKGAELFLMCPGAPNPKVSISLDKVRQVVRPTQAPGRTTIEA